MNSSKLSKERSNALFCYVMLGITCVSLVELCTGGKFGYYFRANTTGTFMDLFESIILNKSFGGKPGIYPPVPDLVYKCLAHMVDFSFIDSSLSVLEQGSQLRADISGAVYIMCHILYFVLPFFVMLLVSINGSLKKKIAYALLLSLSGIVFWSLERGNCIIYAFLFSFLFVFLYSLGDRKSANLAYFCLALAASIKLYPAIFGVVLLEKRDWKGAMVCFAEFVGLYVVAFFCCGYSFRYFGGNFFNVLAWGEGKQLSAYSYSLKNLILIGDAIVRKLSILPFALNTRLLIRLAQIVCMLLCLWVYHDTRRYWEKLFCLSLLCIYIPSISYQYALLFLIIPLVYFLNEKDVGPFDGFYDVAFAVFVSLLVIPVQFPIKITLVVHQLLLLAMCACIGIETLRDRRQRLCQSNSTCRHGA